MRNPENVTPSSIWRGPQMLTRHLVTPEVCPEGAQNPNLGKCAPRSVLVNDENGTDPNPSVARGLSLRYAENAP